MNRIKDYFSFNRKEQRGLIALLVLLLCSISMNLFLPRIISDEYYDTTPYQERIEAFILMMNEMDSLDRTSEHKKPSYIEKEKTASLVPFRNSPFYFDPNKMTQSDWDQMGMDERISRNILRYIEKGGKFHDKKDLSRIYGMTDDVYEILSPYIQIETIKKQTTVTDKPDLDAKKEVTPKIMANTNTVPVQVNINTADSASLLALSGVGPHFAQKIIKYRYQLGGFVSPKQLLEIKGLDSVRLQAFSKEILIDSSEIRKIDLNTVTFKELLKHPYFEYYLVKAIFNYKDQIGAFDSLDQIKNMPVMYDELFDKILPYLEIRSITN